MSGYAPHHYDNTGRLIEHVPTATTTAYPVELTTTPKMAAEMQRRGWRPPAEVIATEEELTALPDGSVVLTSDGKARIYFASLLGPALKLTTPTGGSIVGWLDRLLPAQLLWRAEEDA